MEEIMTLLSKNLCKRCGDQMDMELTISPALKAHIVKKHTDLKMGARPLKRAIQTEIEDKLAEEILAGNVKAGDHVVAGIQGDKIHFKVKVKND